MWSDWPRGWRGVLPRVHSGLGSDRYPRRLWSQADSLLSLLAPGPLWTMVRIVTELACLSCSSLAILFLQCLDYTCSDLKRAILYNAVGNCFFGLIAQTCDNYITFQRYHVIVGKTSKLHRILVILWYIVFLFLPWWPFYLILPIWYDQNSKLFINLYFIMSKSSISEHIYDFS